MSEFKSCPVCQEQSDQCLPCGSYVVDGERIYYGKLKDFGATKDHEVRFINRIQKHHVTAFFHNGKLYIPSRQGRSVPLVIGLQWDAWQEQQAIIDNLKTQLNNMEACYIEKKKEVEGLHKRVDVALFEMQQLSLMLSKDIDGYEDPAQICQSEGVDMGVRILEKALRGEHESN